MARHSKPASVAECPGKIELMIGSGTERTRIERKEMKDSLKTLGVWLNPLGD